MENIIIQPSQCCGKLNDNTRCQNPVLGNSKHCANHYTKAKKLYKSYKKVCEIAKKFDINKTFDVTHETIDYLSKYHNLLNKGLEARLIHRDYAFALECHDKGHDYQFKFLDRKMRLCETKLGDLYNIETKNDITNNVTNITNVNTKNTNTNIKKKNKKKVKQESANKTQTELTKKNNKLGKKISNKIKKFKIHDDDINEIMINNKKENEKNQKDKLLIQTLIINYILKIFGFEKTLDPKCDSDIDDIYMLCLSTHRLVSMLNSIDFFDNDFEGYRLLGDDDGNEYLECMSMNINFGNDIANKKKIKPYFDNFSIGDLKSFYELILFKQNKIKNLIMDVKKLYCIFGLNLLWTSCIITWDVYLDRVVCEQNCEVYKKPDTSCCCQECADRIANGEQFADSSDESSD